MIIPTLPLTLRLGAPGGVVCLLPDRASAGVRLAAAGADRLDLLAGFPLRRGLTLRMLFPGRPARDTVALGDRAAQEIEGNYPFDSLDFSVFLRFLHFGFGL